MRFYIYNFIIHLIGTLKIVPDIFVLEEKESIILKEIIASFFESINRDSFPPGGTTPPHIYSTSLLLFVFLIKKYGSKFTMS